MSSDTYQCKVLATGDRHIDLSMTILEQTGFVDFSPTLVLHALSDVCEPASLRGLSDAETARRLAREHIHEMQLLSEEGREAVFRVGLDPSWVDALSTLEWGSTAYAVDGATAVSVATHPGETKLLVAWSAWRDGPGYAALHTLSKSGLGKRKAILDHHGIVGVAGDDKHWWTAGGQTVKVWSSAGKLKQVVELDGRVSVMTSSPMGPLLALQDGRVQRLGGETLFQGESRATAIAADGEHIIAGFEDGSIWTSGGGRCTLSEAPVEDVAMAGDGRWAAVSGGKLRRGHGGSVGDPETEVETRTVSFFEHGQDGHRVALLQRTSVCVLDLSDPRPVFLPMPSGPVKAASRGAITWAASRSRLDVWRGESLVASASGDWELSSSQTMPQVSPDEAWLAVAKGASGEEGHLFELETGRVRRLAPPEECADSKIQGLYWLSDDRLLVQFSDFYRLRVYRPSRDSFEPYELESGNLLVHDRGIALLCDETQDGGPLQVWVDGAMVATHEADHAYADAVSSTGAIVTMDRSDDGLTLLHRADRSTITLPRFQLARFSANGRWLILALDEGGSVELWDALAGKLTSRTPSEAARILAVDDDGTVRVAAGGAVSTYPLSGEPSSWTPGSIEVEFPYVSVASREDGWLVSSTQPAEKHRVAALPSGRIVQLGRRVRVLPAFADVPKRPR